MRLAVLSFLIFTSPMKLFDYLRAFEYDEVRAGQAGCEAYTIDEFLQHQGGVCRDFAYFTAWTLKRMGFDPHILVYQIEGDKWHSITVFEWAHVGFSGKDLRGMYKFDNRLLTGPYKGFDYPNQTLLEPTRDLCGATQ